MSMPLPLHRKSMMPLKAAVAMVALCFALAGCNGANESASLEQTVAAPQSSSPMVALATNAPLLPAPSQPIAALPGEAGSIASLRSHDYVNGFRQDILLRGSPVRSITNSLTILARTSRQVTLDEATPLFKPTEATIRSELARQFPHMTMQVVERASGNAYGPYGLALGRGDGTIHCIYAWQWIDENRLPAEAGVTGPVSVRIRLCRADTSFDAMAALVDHLTLSRDAGPSYAAAGTSDAAIVAGPDESDLGHTVRRKRARHLAAHRVRGLADARRNSRQGDTGLVGPTFTATPIAGTPSTAPLAMDLPPQAYLGPKAGASMRAN